MSDNIGQDIAISGEENIVVGKGEVIINSPLPAEERLSYDLGILLKSVENTSIKCSVNCRNYVGRSSSFSNRLK